MNEQSSSLIFQEKQYLRDSWVIKIITASVITFFVVFVALFLWPWLNDSFDNQTHSMTTFFIIVIVDLILLWFLLTANLVTEVRRDGVYIRFFPFHWKYVCFGYDEITACEAKQYNPIMDYGGWGIRYSAKGKAYNVKGNFGVLLRMKDGSNVMIGSQKPEKLAQAIQGRQS